MRAYYLATLFALLTMSAFAESLKEIMPFMPYIESLAIKNKGDKVYVTRKAEPVGYVVG